MQKQDPVLLRTPTVGAPHHETLSVLPGPVLLLSRSLQVVYANRAASELWSVTPVMLSGRCLDDLVEDSDVRGHAEAAFNGLAGQHVECVARGSSPSRRLRLRMVACGEPLQLLVQLDDLAEGDRMWGYARRASTRLHAVVDHIHAAILVVDEAGQVVFANPFARRLFGDGEHWKLDDRIPGLAERLEACAVAVTERRLELRAVDGTRFVGEMHAVPLCFRGCCETLVVLRDVGGDEQALEQMRKLSSVAEQTADSIVMTDHEGRVEYVNPAFEQLTGYSAREIVGQTPGVLKSGLHSQGFYQRMWRDLLAGRDFREVFINRRRDGELYYEEKSITPLKDDSGRITHFVSVGRDVSERIDAQQRLDYLAHHDPLTDLPNRMLFMERLAIAIERARNHGWSVGLLFLDLDRFKAINDSLGHVAGDRLLREVAERLRRCMRSGDSVARMGGDECAVVVEGISTDGDIEMVAKKVFAALSEPIHVDGRALYVSASIGISRFPADGLDPDTLFRHADAAMYRAKANGRGQLAFFKSEMADQVSERLQLETDLRAAVAAGQFDVHYQPQVELGSGRIVGMEALLRWHHPDHGDVAPARFVPLLEEIGLIDEVGEWVVRRVWEDARGWEPPGDRAFNLAINLSASQLCRPDAAARFGRLLAQIGYRPGRYLVEFEITEGVLMDDSTATIEALSMLQSLGARVSIDDFGTGFSSLAYLKLFPINTLKIDRTFVRDLVSDSDDRAIVAAIIAMAHGLGLEVLAEGVETPAQLAQLRRLGCDLGQGFLLGRPKPARQIAHLLRAEGA